MPPMTPPAAPQTHQSTLRRRHEEPFAIVFVGFAIALPSGSVGAWSHATRVAAVHVSHCGSGSTTRTRRHGAVAKRIPMARARPRPIVTAIPPSHQEGSGQTNFSNPYGGTATHTYGQGTRRRARTAALRITRKARAQTEMYGAYGGSATHYAGYGTVGTSAYGATAYHAPYYGAAVYPAYHPPTTVNYYSNGCYNCGGWSTAGAAAAGLVVGAAVATAATRPRPTTRTTRVSPTPKRRMPMPTTPVSRPVRPTLTRRGMPRAQRTPRCTRWAGSIRRLPAGCATPTVSGVAYYLCGNNWFLPSYGANGVYYSVVAAP